MDQLRHRLTNVSPKGQTCRADQNPLKRSDLDDFVACYNPKNRYDRKESERFKSFTYEELTKRDKHSIPFERARPPWTRSRIRCLRP
jgi:hypothetical protein